jgi:hypothetical protein
VRNLFCSLPKNGAGKYNLFGNKHHLTVFLIESIAKYAEESFKVN